jgi:hypothetical protein
MDIIRQHKYSIGFTTLGFTDSIRSTYYMEHSLDATQFNFLYWQIDLDTARTTMNVRYLKESAYHGCLEGTHQNFYGLPFEVSPTGTIRLTSLAREDSFSYAYWKNCKVAPGEWERTRTDSKVYEGPRPLLLELYPDPE